ncbi:unnamed protein product [Penicillium viridicatum]
MSDPRLVDMEPGGESTQYESIRQFTKSPPKQTGQLGVGDKHTTSEVSPGLGTDSPAPSNDEDFQAQKLGMGAIADSGKDKISIGGARASMAPKETQTADDNVQKI